MNSSTGQLNRLRGLTSQQFEHPRGAMGALLAVTLIRRNVGINRMVVHEMLLQPDHHVLELGFGPGHAIYLVAKEVPAGSVSGLELAPLMIRIARFVNRKISATSGFGLQRGTWDDLPYPDNAFDRIFTVNTAHFWNNPMRVIAEIRRVLKPNGVLAVAFRCQQWPADNALRLPPTDPTRQVNSTDQIEPLLRSHFDQVRVVNGGTRRGLVDTCATMPNRPLPALSVITTNSGTERNSDE